jgi:hypothetical protein
MISPGGFALGLVILTVVWFFVPDGIRPMLFILLVLSVLGTQKEPARLIRGFFGNLK